MKAQRTLSPTAAPIEWRDLIQGLAGLARPDATRNDLKADFRRYFGVRHVWLVSSGKTALTVILRALHGLSARRTVVMPGYTCFSVPSAVVRAGLSVRLCDVDPLTLNLELPHLSRVADSGTLCVLATHLLGVGVDVKKVAELCRPRGVFVVEDVAQAFGGRVDEQPLGSIGDVAFLSFGRGKNITCGSGGAILTNDDRIGEAIDREYAGLPEVSIPAMLKNWLEVAVTQMLIHPSRYWFPAGLPFLGLGETTFYTDFLMARMDAVRAGLLRRWKERLTYSTASRVAHAAELQRVLSHDGVQTIQPYEGSRSVYLRFPILMRSRQEKEALCRLSREQGLGISPLYPSTIRQIAELSEVLSAETVPHSAMIADRLVTLPTHEMVCDQDIQRVFSVIGTMQQAQISGEQSVSGRSPRYGSEIPKPN
ncbi:MAG: DegT/DnrJ/EryC1/StrS family aminotransferase [Nitrospira sp.]|nr:DegT/DnrJ/EryC1/StrS family aminotransferase [Nitrospira sp.]